MRLDDLSRLHDLPFRKAGMVYRFGDFAAYGLDQDLGFAEGYDRALERWKDAAKNLRVLADHHHPKKATHPRSHAPRGNAVRDAPRPWAGPKVATPSVEDGIPTRGSLTQ